MHAIVNFVTYSDTDFVVSYQWQTSVDPDPVTYFDLFGYKMLMQVRKNAEDIEVLINLTTENGGILIESTSEGKFDVDITREDLARLPAGDYVHSMLIEHPNGFRDAVWRGTLTHIIGPTR